MSFSEKPFARTDGRSPTSAHPESHWTQNRGAATRASRPALLRDERIHVLHYGRNAASRCAIIRRAEGGSRVARRFARRRILLRAHFTPNGQEQSYGAHCGQIARTRRGRGGARPHCYRSKSYAG